ncbi:hypothetical protein V8E52_005079 [Russula decolorans]
MTSDMEAQTKSAQNTSSQPGKSIQMDALNTASTVSSQHEHQHKARRLRGGGAARECFIGLVGCFEGCECCADIVCCPCEMCC